MMTNYCFTAFLAALLFLTAPTTLLAADKVPFRQDIAPQYQWHLQDIYASDAHWQQDYDKLKSQLPQLATYQGKLGASPQTLLQCLKQRDEMSITLGRLYSYAKMHRDENTATAAYQALTDKASSLGSLYMASASFIEPELLALSPETIPAFLRQEPALKEYSRYLQNLLRQRQHILSPAEEALLSKASELGQMPENTFDMLTNADLRFPDITDSQGTTLPLSEGKYRAYMSFSDRQLRQNAYLSLYRTYAQYRNTLASTLNGNIKSSHFFASTRKYPSTLAASLDNDNIPVAVYDNVITTVKQNLAPLHRYAAFKKAALGLDEFHLYDASAPVTQKVQPHYTYEEARQLVQAALEPLGSEYNTVLTQGITSGWIDVYENQGKQSGAYSWGTYGTHPFVFLNYEGTYDSVSTLAHELGHAMHTYYSYANQPFTTSDYSLFCAEVASQTNEILLVEYMLKHTQDTAVRKHLLEQYLDTILGSVYRQTQFAEFEKIIHERTAKGDALTADDFDAIWHNLNLQYWGPDAVLDKESDVGWSRIPHFYRNFYVYQYATGYAAATALSEQILTGGEPARQKYLQFLKSGSSDDPLQLLRRAGVDMATPLPLEITLQKFSRLLDELESL
nr:oligoendopeptidase F [uncultured Anaeromusa sp.]